MKFYFSYCNQFTQLTWSLDACAPRQSVVGGSGGGVNLLAPRSLE